MYNAAFMMAQSTDELVYIIAVLIIIGVGWVSERVKAKMAERDQKTPPRPGRRPSTSLPRPHIESMPDVQERPGRTRPAVPPAAQRPQPPARPPLPGRTPTARPFVPEETGRTVGPPKPTGRPRPAPSRTVEEARSIVRGEPVPRPTRPSTPPPTRPKPQVAAPVPPAEEKESWARLAEWGQGIRAEAEAKQMGQIKPAEAIEAAVVRGRVGAESFRHLTTADLQRAFVLKEILEPPLAMREG